MFFSEIQRRSKERFAVLHSSVFPVFPRAKAEAEARFSSASAELDLRRSLSARLDTQRDVNDRIHETMMCYAIRRLVSEKRNSSNVRSPLAILISYLVLQEQLKTGDRGEDDPSSCVSCQASSRLRPSSDQESAESSSLYMCPRGHLLCPRCIGVSRCPKCQAPLKPGNPLFFRWGIVETL